MDHPAVSHLFLTTLTERLSRVSITDMPRFVSYDQKELQELRTG